MSAIMYLKNYNYNTLIRVKTLIRNKTVIRNETEKSGAQ